MNDAQQLALLNFVKDILFTEDYIWSDVYGDIQNLAVKHGLMNLETRTSECGENCECIQYLLGNEERWTCYHIVEWLRS